MSQWKDEWVMDGWMDRQEDGWVLGYGKMWDGWVGVWIGGRMNAWMKWMNKC